MGGWARAKGEPPAQHQKSFGRRPPIERRSPRRYTRLHAIGLPAWRISAAMQLRNSYASRLSALLVLGTCLASERAAAAAKPNAEIYNVGLAKVDITPNGPIPPSGF